MLLARQQLRRSLPSALGLYLRHVKVRRRLLQHLHVEALELRQHLRVRRRRVERRLVSSCAGALGGRLDASRRPILWHSRPDDAIAAAGAVLAAAVAAAAPSFRPLCCLCH